MADFADARTSVGGLGVETGTATTTVTAGKCSVLIGDATVVVEVARDLTVAVGDVLLLARQGSARWAIARLFVAAPPPPPVEETPDTGPPPKPAVVSGRLVVAPVTTQSRRDGKWRTDTPDVLQGKAPGSSFGRNTGCAFYGSKPRSLAGATVTRAAIRVRRDRGGVFGASTSTLRLVAEKFRPSGAPTLGASTTGPSMAINTTNNGFVIPDSWAQAMVDNTAGGLAVHVDADTPYIRFAGKGSWSPAWTLVIDWTRTT